ncbi:hypothetical protein BEH94_05880 [Candidatus Altiarchaeales archaeon WOR_SM1_SCG]|nr:hypothetical protein BEH94_05880 [Candidatus Altiarchaeales archaeon WOR_SM1_SCG]
MNSFPGNVLIIDDKLDILDEYKKEEDIVKYLFSWDDIPGNDSMRILKFLKNNLQLEWVENAEIKKSDNGEAITLTKGENSLIFKLNKEESKVNLEISGGKTYEYILKKEKGKLNICIDDINTKYEYTNLKRLVDFFETEGIPVMKISDTQNLQFITEYIQKLRNIRLLILDLDLNGDGNVDLDDEELIRKILEISVKEYGYFFLLINSAHKEKWEEIKENIHNDIHVKKVIENLSHVFSKEDDLWDTLEKIMEEKFSLNLIYKFEQNLNKARDSAFREFIDFDTDTWNNLIHLMSKESGEIVHSNITNIMLVLLKQHMLSVKYNPPNNCSNQSRDKDIIKNLYKSLNYVLNENEILDNDPIWTGNLYKTNYTDIGKKLALVITPECDIAQKNNIEQYKVLYGFEINDTTFCKYDHKDNNTVNIPLFTKRAGRSMNNNNWRSRKDLNQIKNPNQYLYILPFAIENNSTCMDFRFSETVSKEDTNTWNLKLRVIEPLITDIMDKYSNLFNRKGLIDFPFKEAKINLLEDE